MYPKLLHIYSDLYINSYGLAIAVGLALFTWLLSHDTQAKKLTSSQELLNIIQLGFVIALIAGRLGVFLTEPNLYTYWYEWFMLWKGGFSILGSILGIVLLMPCILKKKNIPILPFLDRVSVYAPLLQSISRIGCFLAGCCAGKPTSSIWAVTYYDPACMTQLYVPLHPTQLYSSILLLIIFFFLYFGLQQRTKHSGVLFFSYLLLVSFERFIVDFFRADHINAPELLYNLFSIHQWIALLLFVGACLGLWLTNRTASHEYI